MAEAKARKRRTRGSIRERGGSFQVLVYSGIDPLTGRQLYLSASAPDRRSAEKARTRLLGQVDDQRAAVTRLSLGHLLDAWLDVHDADPMTVKSYRRSAELRIKPALGKVAAHKITAQVLEKFYAELRRCRDRCDGRPFVEHRTEKEHDCEADDPSTVRKCKPHQCKPYSAGTIRETASIISGALATAVRWDWIPNNPSEIARKPRQTAPKPSPPSPAEAGRILAAAAEAEPDWGMFVWLAMVTGARRGELVALRWLDIDIGQRMVEIRRNYVDGVEKETKTHQIRRVSIDETTASMLSAHRDRYRARVASLQIEPVDSAFVFSHTPDHSRPCDADAVSHRYTAMCARLGVKSHLHALRHYTATELISAGVDIRTVAGRLGHGGGGTTTLRVYTAWVAESDRRAADILAARMSGSGAGGV